MAARKILSFVLLAPFGVNAAVQGSGTMTPTVNEKGQAVQQMKIEAPAMTEEDQWGYNMPDMYKCDSCRAVVYHLNAALESKQPKSRRLQEWEYQDVFDNTCRSGFAGYGIKLINGENVLSGPGLKQQEELSPGMGAIQMGGEKWEKRLREICRQVVEKIGEDVLYERFQKDGSLSESACFDKDVRSCGASVSAAKSSKKLKNEETQKMKASLAEEQIGVMAMMQQIAKESGLPTDTYTQKRTREEWRRTLAQLSSSIIARSQGKKVVTV